MSRGQAEPKECLSPFLPASNIRRGDTGRAGLTHPNCEPRLHCLQDPWGGRISSRKLERFAVKETMRAFQGCIDDYQTLQCEAGLIEVTGLAGFIGRKHSLGVFFCPSASLHYWHL